ncbi:MAG: hypothetical protein AABW50_00805 [Nanoarchaeota archaeon]
MRLNFKKISALGTSILLTGMTLGVAAAANYPAPFVQGGAADVAIVVGTGQGVSVLDSLQAGYMSTDLQSKMGSGTGGTNTGTTGETVSLDTSSTRIWLNTSLNTAFTQLTKSQLPTVLADYTFSGNVESKLTSTIKLVAGAAAGAEGSGKVIFGKIPTSSTDPIAGISMGSSQTSNPLYNASVTMGAINFTHADSEGEEITLFGQTFTVASATDGTNLVLLKEAEKLTLDSEINPSSTVTISGSTYTIELISTSDTAATIKVTDSAGASASKEIAEAASKKIQGITIAVVNADETNLKLSATVIAGAEKITLTNGATVTTGESSDPVLGTYAYIVGGTTATTEIAITVFAPDSSNDAILSGSSFVDPFFGSFKFDFAGLNTPLEDAGRGQILVTPSGDKDMTLTVTDDSSNTKSFEFAHNESNMWKLGDSNNYSIATIEMANLSTGEDKRRFTVVGNEEYGHLLQLYDVYNATTGSNSVTNDRVKFRDIISGETYETTFVSTEGSGTLSVEGKTYTVTFGNTGDDGWVQLKYPTADSAASKYVVYPTIQLKGGSIMALYEPLVVNLTGHEGGAGAGTDVAGFEFPDGDGYTSVAVAYSGDDAGDGFNNTWTFGGAPLNTSAAANANNTLATVGKYVVNFTSTGVANQTKIYINDPEVTANKIDNPGIIFFESKGDVSTNDYHVIIVDLETAPAGTSTDGVGVNDLLFSSTTHWEATLATDSDITKHVDYYGTLASYDANTASKAKATISYPASQVYSQIYVGSAASTVTPGATGSVGSSTPLGKVIVTDAETSSVATKNLIVVGGSCINSAAATLVGGAYCGSQFTDSMGVSAGQFVIKGYTGTALTSKLALLVAGYNKEDTVNAAEYLRTKVVDTGKHYKGTSSTSADLVTTTTA